jgi:hypothetical protein
MKVDIGPYENFFGPYQLAEKLCFWAKPVVNEYGIKDKPDWVHDFGEWLAHGSVIPDATPDNTVSFKWKDRPKTLLYRFLLWLNSKKERKIKVRIDRWDTWGADHTLAYIILPVLESLKESKSGAPHVDDSDVPEELRRTSAPPLSQEDIDCGVVDELYFKRWDWVLDEMIFAFRNKLDDDWKDQFFSGESDMEMKAIEFDEDGKPKLYQLVSGPNDTFKIDKEGMNAYQERISAGFRLFGKYYENLWS